MVQIIKESRKPSFSEQLGVGLGQLIGKTLPREIERSNERDERSRMNAQLQELIGMNVDNLPPEMQKLFAQKVLEQQMQDKQQDFQRQMQQEKFGFTEQLNNQKQRQEAQESENKQNLINQAIFKMTGKDLSGLPPDMQKIFLNKIARTPDHERLKDIFMKRGVKEDDAELYAYLTTGGQTEFIKKLIDEEKRSGKSFIPNAEEETELEHISSKVKKETPESKFEKDFADYIVKRDEDLLPEEKIKRGKERFDTGLKQYQEAGEKLRSMTRDKERIDILKDLNKSKKLPKDLQRLNVDLEGNLRLPYLASPESQRFVKTLNEFSVGAKDTFGSRVTNFDLSQYLKRYPTLMNTTEGRRQLLDQMEIVNQINSVYYKNLKNVYDKAGGVRNIDADVAERFSEQLSENKVNELSQKFKDIGQFLTRPDPKEFEGKKIKDTETGEVFISNGTEWVPEEK
jgi:hypothetical protein